MKKNQILLWVFKSSRRWLCTMGIWSLLLIMGITARVQAAGTDRAEKGTVGGGDRQEVTAGSTGLLSVLQPQTKELRGVVRDPQGQPLLGATVMAKGTSVGAITDVEGRFT